MENEIIESEEYKEYDKYGYTSDYVSITNNDGVITVAPAFSAESLIKQGFATKGTKVQFLNKNGSESERKEVIELGIVEGQELTVVSCDVGDWRSKYTFEEIEGEYNTVMFR